LISEGFSFCADKSAGRIKAVINQKFGTVEKNLFRKDSLSVDLQNGKVKIIPYLDELKELESLTE